jgi:hypothetical protein
MEVELRVPAELRTTRPIKYPPDDRFRPATVWNGLLEGKNPRQELPKFAEISKQVHEKDKGLEGRSKSMLDDPSNTILSDVERVLEDAPAITADTP